MPIETIKNNTNISRVELLAPAELCSPMYIVTIKIFRKNGSVNSYYGGYGLDELVRSVLIERVDSFDIREESYSLLFF